MGGGISHFPSGRKANFSHVILKRKIVYDDVLRMRPYIHMIASIPDGEIDCLRRHARKSFR